MIKRLSPTRSYFFGYEDKIEELKSLLSYTDMQAKYEADRFENAVWYIQKYGPKEHAQRLKELREATNPCCLKKDDVGYYTYSGLESRIAEHFKDTVVNEVEYPENKIIPWNKVPPFQSRYYQTESVEKLTEAKHASIELATGLGKSKIILDLVKHHGLKTLIMVPSISIAQQLYKMFAKYFGEGKVGLFGDKKKKSGKLITIGIAASLAKIKPQEDSWKQLANCSVFIVDESHLTPAATLERVCMKLAGDVPYRYFVSGTQFRGDGQDLILEGIIGPNVYSMDLRQGVDEGFLAKPRFIMIESKTGSNKIFSNPIDSMKVHFYNNKYLHKQAAALINKLVLSGKQTLVLLEHIEQFQHIYPYLKVDCKFAHGGVTEQNKKYVPVHLQKCEPTELVEEFNEGKIKLLFGTSCVSTGTDFLSVESIVDIMGGRSEVHIRQALGRGTRIHGNKKSFLFFDFIIRGEKPTNVEKHSLFRQNLYSKIYSEPEIWEFKI